MEQWICWTVDDTHKRVKNWGITTHEGRRGLKARWGGHFLDQSLSAKPQDVWMRGEPLALPERVLYLLAEYDWPQSAIRALADAVYAITHSEVK